MVSATFSEMASLASRSRMRLRRVRETRRMSSAKSLKLVSFSVSPSRMVLGPMGP